MKTGSVSATSGKVSVGGRLVTGAYIHMGDAARDQTIQAALKLMESLDTGGVTGTSVEIESDLITGFVWDGPAIADREAFVAELEQLKRALAELQKQPGALPAAAEAAQAAGQALDEAKAKAPAAKRLRERLYKVVTGITMAGKALDAADKIGTLTVKALPIALGLYQVADKLFR